MLGTVSEQTSLKSDWIAEVNAHSDAEHASNSGRVSLNMHHLVLFLASSICWIVHFPYSYFPHYRGPKLSLLKVKLLWSDIEGGLKIRSIFTNAKWVHCKSPKNINRSQAHTYSTLHQGPSCLFWNAIEVLQTELAPKAKCISKKAQLSGTHNQVKMWAWELNWWSGVCSVISPSCPQTSVRIWNVSRSE